jgi:hypothetical protein
MLILAQTVQNFQALKEPESSLSVHKNLSIEPCSEWYFWTRRLLAYNFLSPMPTTCSTLIIVFYLTALILLGKYWEFSPVIRYVSVFLCDI